MQMRTFHTPIGCLTIRSDTNVITALEYGAFVPSGRKVSMDSNSTPFWRNVRQQLEEYFFENRMEFDLPCETEGTDYQQRVWQALNKIPAGKTLTYGELAKKLRSHARAIGMACRRNPIPLFIPCHRVVSATGVGGFAGESQGSRVDLKKWLLQHEAAVSKVVKIT